MLDSAFAIALTLHVLLVSRQLGAKFLGWLPEIRLSEAETVLLSTALGIGSVSSLITLLGLTGLLHPPVLIVVLLGLTILLYRGIARSIGSIPELIGRVPASWQNCPVWERTYTVLAILILGIAGLQALTPENGYDPLVYHLQAPRLFLNAGRIYPETESWLVNLPLSIQMLYTLGLSLGAESFARLTHLAFGILLVLSAQVFAKRLIPSSPSWLAGAVVLASPSLPIWASHAHVDVAWAALEGLACFAAISWVADRRASWLILSGAFSGLALATKPVAALGLFAVGLFLLWHHRRDFGVRALQNLAAFGLPVVALASPWYLKNWVWFGHPFFPIAIASNDPSVVERWDLTRSYVVEGLSAGRKPLELLVLPVRLYLESGRIGQTLMDGPSPLLIFSALLPFVPAAPARTVLAMLAIRYAGFVATSHQPRFLLPVTVLASLPIATSISHPRFKKPLLLGFAVVSVVVTLAAILLRTAQTRPLPVILGMESKEDFLARTVDGYRTLEYISKHVLENETVYLVGDSRRYYCPAQCDPEADQFGWARLTDGGTADIGTVMEELNRRGATFLLVSYFELSYLQRNDPSGTITSSYDFIREELEPQCLDLVFSEGQVDLFRIDCDLAPSYSR